MNYDRLTLSQTAVLNFLHEFQEREGCMPTRAEIASRFNWKSANSAEEHLQCLGAKGAITLRSGISRGIRFTDRGRALLSNSATTVPPPQNQMLRLPVYDMRRLPRITGKPRALERGDER